MSGGRFLSSLNRLYLLLRKQKRERWDRVLPFSEHLVDRWEKARFLGFGEGASIYDSASVYGQVRVGAHTWVGPQVILDGSGGLSIGDHCSISSGAQIYSHNTVSWALSGGQQPYDYQAVRIGRCCFIGPLAVIRAGVSIGDHCVIGAGSFVNSDLPSHSIAAGQPARVIGVVRIDAAGQVILDYSGRAQ